MSSTEKSKFSASSSFCRQRRIVALMQAAGKKADTNLIAQAGSSAAAAAASASINLQYLHVIM